MTISIWIPFAIICAAGGIGGVVNALLSDNGFILPRTQHVNDRDIIRPGVLGNVLIGLVAAGLSWGLYGPLSNAAVFGSLPATNNFTLSSLVGAALVGIAGARWITNEVDKKFLTAAVSQAALAQPDPQAAQKVTVASPLEALKVTQNMQA